jgi:hypothetical protein
MIHPYGNHLKNIFYYIKDKRFKDICRELKFIFQKIYLGFSVDELWDLDFILASYILPRLKEFKNRTPVVPSKYNNMNEWYSDLDDMIYSFQSIVNILDLNTSELDNEKYELGLKKFGENFSNLWW